MSTGKLCGNKIKISRKINNYNDIEVSCDLYEGHEGDHSAMLYHCKSRSDSDIFTDNYRLGRIKWKEYDT